jgi:transketolase
MFDAQAQDYRDKVLGDVLRVAIEAASPFGWERYLGANGVMIGMAGFGASAPAPALYKHFGITADAMVAAVKSRLKG